jgi:large subunit ribosomal protein L7e
MLYLVAQSHTQHFSVNSVPESVLKKSKADAKAATKAKISSNINKVATRKLRTEAAKRGAKYAAQYERLQKSEVAAKRFAKTQGNLYVEAEPKLAFVVRIRG